MQSSMNQIQSSVQDIFTEFETNNKQIREIVQVISEIGEKTKVINDIVFQTKLLSFNASVEAARAGEHGKGFAVVAEEVGNLAQMSGRSAKEISDMLESGIKKVHEIVDQSNQRVSRLMESGKSKISEGFEQSRTCGEKIDDIVSNIGKVDHMTTDLNSAVVEQTNGTTEISKAVQLFSQSTEQNAQISNEAHAISSELNDQIRLLNGLISTFESVVQPGAGSKSNGPGFSDGDDQSPPSRDESHDQSIAA
jgi:methyl-accepting chemotaxis protein